MKNIYKHTFWVILLSIIAGPVLAQEEEDKGKLPVRDPFESALLIDNQSVVIPSAKTLEFDMIHRFGSLENGMSDFFGLYAPGANVRLGLTYSVKDNLSLGVGFSKLNTYLDLNIKYAIFKQTRDWGIPVSVTYFGNMGIDNRESENFEKSVHRYSYFHQALIATRFGPRLSLQISPSYAHFNAVDSLMSNDIFAVGFSGRYKFGAATSFIFDFIQPVTSHDDIVDLQPNIGFGVEFSTSSHAFHTLFRIRMRTRC